MNKRTGKMTLALTPQELQTLMVALKIASEQMQKKAERATRRAQDAKCIAAQAYCGMAESVDELKRKVWTRMMRESADILTEIIL